MNREEVVERLNKLDVTTPIVFADGIGCSVDSLNDPEVFQKASEAQHEKWVETMADKYMKMQNELNRILPAETTKQNTSEVRPLPNEPNSANSTNETQMQSFYPAASAMQALSAMEINAFSDDDCNDSDTADNICRILDGSYIYVAEEKNYYMWDSKRWVKQHPLEFKNTVISILQKRFKYVASNQINVDVNYARKGCDNKKIDDIIQIINAKIYVSEDKLNNDKGLLCLKNCVYDLFRKQAFRHEAYKDRYITRMIDVDFDSALINYKGVFHEFIMDIMSYEEDTADYLQRVFGYAIMGNPAEQKCFVLIGSGANGKTTLIDAIREVLGDDYCTTMSKKVLMTEDRGGANEASPAIVQLKGKRIAFASELKHDGKIVEAQFKKLIGGGKLAGRGLYKNMTEFYNESTIFIDTNHLPAVETGGSEAAHAIFRRIEIIPFKQRYTEFNRNPDLPDLLSSEYVKKEILAWLIDGVNKYAAYKLTPTEEMVRIKNEYMKRENSVLQFFDSCVIKTGCEDDFVCSGDLYKLYKQFCKTNGMTEVNSARFFKSEVLCGINRFRTAKEREYQGIKLI